jgi:hypothetical protein
MSTVFPTLIAKQPTEVDSHLIVARDLMPVVESLSKIDHLPSRGCAMLAAHTLECTLKAIILHCGKFFEQGQRHNLIELWIIAHSTGMIDIQTEPPDWVKILATGHGPHFYLRYQQGVKRNFVHGGQAPLLAPMASDLRSLLDSASNAIAAGK